VLTAGITESVLEEELPGGGQRRGSGRLGMGRNGSVSGAATESAALVGAKGAGTSPRLAAVPSASSRVVEVQWRVHHSGRFEGQHRRLGDDGRHGTCTWAQGFFDYGRWVARRQKRAVILSPRLRWACSNVETEERSFEGGVASVRTRPRIVWMDGSSSYYVGRLAAGRWFFFLLSFFFCLELNSRGL
jgi:hypothetical protein